MRCTKVQSSSTTNKCIYRGNCYAESIHSTKPPGGERDIPDTKLHIKNKSPLKRHYTLAYKPEDPPPIGYKERTRNTGATIIISREPAQY